MSDSPDSQPFVVPEGGKRTLLFVGDLVPYPHPLIGGQIRTDQILRQLLRDFRVVFASTSRLSSEVLRVEWELAAQLEEVISVPRDFSLGKHDPLWGNWPAVGKGLMPSRVPAIHRYAWSRALVRELIALFQEHDIAAVWASGAPAAEMVLAAGGPPTIVDMDDLDGQVLTQRIANQGFFKRRAMHRLHARRLIRYERKLPRRFAGVAVSKLSDLQFLDGAAGHQWIIPNGIVMRPLQFETAPSSASLLFVGSLGHPPNQHGVSWFVHEVLPKIRDEMATVRFVVAGRGPVDASWCNMLSDNLVEIVDSPIDLEPLYRDAAVVVAPLLEGGGTSIKVLEALAYAKGLVATPMAIRGIDVENNDHCLVGSNAYELAQHCLRLLSDPELAAQLGARGRELVGSRYSWDQVGVAIKTALACVIRP